jgi:hypothetical protein
VERQAIAPALPEVNLNQQVRAMGTVEEVYQTVKELQSELLYLASRKT